MSSSYCKLIVILRTVNLNDQLKYYSLSVGVFESLKSILIIFLFIFSFSFFSFFNYFEFEMKFVGRPLW